MTFTDVKAFDQVLYCLIWYASRDPGFPEQLGKRETMETIIIYRSISKIRCAVGKSDDFTVQIGVNRESPHSRHYYLTFS